LTPEDLVRELIRNGWRQNDIARRLEVTQPTISRIQSGRLKRPNYVVVEALRTLVAEADTPERG
jgi:transcriptional regulator with XRE-family HTH domain